MVETRDFEAEPSSVRSARAFVLSVVGEHGRAVPELLSLLVSEIASNAVLHARSPYSVTVTLPAEVVRVEVSDLSPVMPSARTPDPLAPTGRGIRLVADNAEQWGAEPHEDGKIVWFELRTTPETPIEPAAVESLIDPGAVAPADSASGPEDEADELFAVRIVGLPVALYERSARHHEALQREFDLIRSAEPGAESVPHALLTLIAQLDQRFGRFSGEQEQQLADAVADGLDSIDLAYQFPVDAAAASRQLGDLLDLADNYCRTGNLLTLATPPDQREFREWLLGEIVGQIAGGPATAWPDHRPAPRSTASGVEATGGVDEPDIVLPDGWSHHVEGETFAVGLTGDLDLLSAPTLRDLLQRVGGSGATVVAIDATGVDFMDSVAISVLVSARNRLAHDGVDLTLRASATVFRSLQLTGLEQVLSVTG